MNQGANTSQGLLPCSACGGQMHHSFETLDYNREISDDIYDYARCGNCGLISLVTVPEDLGRYYPADYHQVPRDDAAIEAGAAHDRYKIDLVRRFAGTGQLLEIGPAWGAFSLLAKRAGFAVEAIDMDATCCRFLESRIGVRAIHAEDEAKAVREATVPDVVAAWHVLEHLRNPWKLLDQVAGHLKPGGIVVLALPNPEAFQFRVMGKRWVHIDAPRHLHIVPPSVLRRRATLAGLEQIFLTTNDEGSLGWNEFGWRYSLRLFAKHPRAKRLLGIAGRIATTLFAPIERQEGRGSAYTAVFRKPLSA